MAPGTTEFVPPYADLIGKPFEWCARGPDKFDCYGLVEEMHRRKGVRIPDVLSPTEQSKVATLLEAEALRWVKAEIAPGAVLTFRIGIHDSHVGFVIDHYRFIHVWQGARLGVAVERIDVWERRITGVFRFKPT